MPKGVYKRIKPVSEETRKKMSIAQVGKKHSNETRKKMSMWQIGRKLSNEHKKHIGLSSTGRKHSEETKKKISIKGVGRITSEETKEKIRQIRFKKPIRYWLGKRMPSKWGKENSNWKGGITPINTKIRNSTEFEIWREWVFKRDNHTCQKYGTRGGDLHAHHILNFSSHPEGRFDINNGITLSVKAHKEFHKKYGNKNNTREQIEEFIKN